MKVIDYEKKGNLVRFYLGKDDCDDYHGDDWDDAPYQCNAGRVYDKYIVSYIDETFPFDYAVLEPCDTWGDTEWSKNDMKEKRVPFLVVIKSTDEVKYDDFNQALANEKSEKYYLGMHVNINWD